MSLLKKIKKIIGPSIITGASDDDPSGIATYSQAGAGYGLQMLWMAIVTFPMMVTIQEMCARISYQNGLNWPAQKILSSLGNGIDVSL